MLFDGGDAVKRVVDFLTVAGMVFYRGFDVPEPLLDIGELLHDSDDVPFCRHLLSQRGEVDFCFASEIGDVFGDRGETIFHGFQNRPERRWFSARFCCSHMLGSIARALRGRIFWMGAPRGVSRKLEICGTDIGGRVGHGFWEVERSLAALLRGGGGGC